MVKKLGIIFFMLVFLSGNLFAAEETERDELLKLWQKVIKFEKEMPFFTKSKLSVFFKFDKIVFSGMPYALYINGNLVKSGTAEVSDTEATKSQYIGTFPVRSGKIVVAIKTAKGAVESEKKFEMEVPEFRRLAVEFSLSDVLEKPKIVPKAWVVE